MMPTQGRRRTVVRDIASFPCSVRRALSVAHGSLTETQVLASRAPDKRKGSQQEADPAHSYLVQSLEGRKTHSPCLFHLILSLSSRLVLGMFIMAS